jgi:hypothetical protein
VVSTTCISSIRSYPSIYSVSNCFLASAMTFCKYNNSSTRPNFFGSFLNAILKSSTFNLCRGAAILAASRHCLNQRCIQGWGGGGTISLMYSVTMSSRTVTDSGEGFGSSPNAYINNFTSVSWMRRDLYNLFGRGSVCVRCDDGEHVPPSLSSKDLSAKICVCEEYEQCFSRDRNPDLKYKGGGWMTRSFKE